MSKLNRREFKELLLEWKQNFINEKGPLSKYYKKKIPASLCPVSSTELVELSNFVINLVNSDKKREDFDFHELGESVYSHYNFSVPKDKNILTSMLTSSNNEKIENYVKSALKEVEEGNKDPVIFFLNIGNQEDSNVVGKKVRDDEVASYVTHDLEHVVFTAHIIDSEDSARDVEARSNEKERHQLWDYKKDHSVDNSDFYYNTMRIAQNVEHDIEKLDKIANKEDIEGLEYTVQEANATKIENAFKRFFNKINYAVGINIGDVMPSVWAYCISNMKDKHDLDDVNNSKIDKEDKEIICDILENSHDNCMKTFVKFLESQNNRIVFINMWGE